MKKNFFLYYILLVIAQVLISEWFTFSPYLTLSILPVLVLCIPTRYSTIASMLIAFATGFAVDFLSEGLVGLNILALVPVAAVRESLIRGIFGEDPIIRHESFTVRKYGAPKVFVALTIVQSLFLAIYIAADGGLERPFLFSLLRSLISLAAGLLLSVFVFDTLTSESRR